ncbi:MAG: serine/threonine protein kinase [Fuerstiella sp.]|nr:serine/threonine protein kinase [Fuerstiella sp.]MCP4855104.1 serine/threonine protein kinase [Fuerstiella sp.]
MSESRKNGSAPNGSQQAAKKKKALTRVGDFELKKKLGKGGMGEVFLARQVSLDRIVALKTLSKELAKKEDFVARFLREARSMAKLDHVNVVKVYAVDSYKGLHFAAIEYVDGKSVQDWLDKLTRFSIGDAVHIAMVSAEGMKHAHDQNMVHRDIKPDNILLTTTGIVKVADFGLAKVLDDDVSMTQSGTGLGTPLYMAPEQARSAKTVDQRCDIYALGVMLYHMLTGKLPYGGETALELIIAKETGKYDTARKICPEVPERLDLIVDKMMARETNHRYNDCAEVIKDLAALGVQNDPLSFVDGALPTGIGRSVSPTTADMGGTAVSGGPLPTSRQVARTAKVKQASRTWYVQFQDANKKTVVDKLSTGRVLKMLQAGMLTAKSQAKVSSDGSYLPLAQFPEFTEAVERQVSRQSTDVRREDLKNLYKQVERDQKKITRWRWLTRKFRGLVGGLSLVIWLAAIGGLIWLGATYGKAVFDYVGQAVTDKINAPDDATDDTEE